MANEIIAYFSRGGANYVNGVVKKLMVGNTEVAANILRNITDADLFRIEPLKPYSANYYVCIDEAKRDLQRGVRPELVACPASLDHCDILYLGYPNYWGTMPMAVVAFLERYDFTGKTILPFCTHEGGGMGRSETDLRRICPTAHVLKGLPIKGTDVRLSYELLERWVSERVKG